MEKSRDCVYAVLALGSNLEPKSSRVLSAISWLSEVSEVVSATRPYETPPLGGGKRRYCNAVVTVVFHGSRQQLESLAKEYEVNMGRDDACRMRGDVPIDVDVVVADGIVLRKRDFESFYFKMGLQLLEE